MTTFVDKICAQFNISYSALSDKLDYPKNNYTAHSIKGKGKIRTVFAPNEELRQFQAYVVEAIMQKCRVSPHCTAYERGASIRNNAQTHQMSPFVAKFDIDNFFGSITFWHFEEMLHKYFDNFDIKLMWKICSLDNSLPVGAPSSPFIANRVMTAFDNTLIKNLRGVKYTRYADDLTFSSNNPLPHNLESELTYALEGVRMRLNSKKTKYYNPKTPKRITGVTITPEKDLTVGKRYKETLKKQIYQYQTHKKGNKKSIIGKLNYVKHIEPTYYRKLVKKYNLSKDILKRTERPSINDIRIKMQLANNQQNTQYRQAKPTIPNSTNNYQTITPKGCLRIFIIAFSILVVLSIVITLARVTNSETRTLPPPSTITLNDNNYQEHLTIMHGYAIGMDYTEFSINLIAINCQINNLEVVFKIITPDQSVFYTDTITIDVLTSHKRINYTINQAVPSFEQYQFYYQIISGTVM